MATVQDSHISVIQSMFTARGQVPPAELEQLRGADWSQVTATIDWQAILNIILPLIPALIGTLVPALVPALGPVLGPIISAILALFHIAPSPTPMPPVPPVPGGGGGTIPITPVP